MSKPSLFQRLVRCGIVGGVVAGVFTGLNWLLGHWLGKDASFIVAYPPSVLLHYWLNKTWTFGVTQTVSRQQKTEYLVMALVMLAVQAPIFKILTATTNLPGWAAAAFASAGQMAFSFAMMQFRIFGRAPVAE